MLSPGQLWKGAAYLFLAGVDTRIGHQYPHLGHETSGFLLTHAIPEAQDRHDIEQNLALLKPLDINTAPYSTSAYSTAPVPDSSKQSAAKKLVQAGVTNNSPRIALHAGSASGFEWKRWSLESFAATAKQLRANHNASFVIVGGKAEIEPNKALATMIGDAAHIFSGTLLETQAALETCQLTIANDSGLMHLSAASGTPTLGLFGPTNELEVGPRGKLSRALRAPDTKPVYTTEAGSDLGNTTHESLAKLSPDLVAQHAQELFATTSE